MIAVVLALFIVPAAVGLACLALTARTAAMVTAVSGIASFALVLALVPAAAHANLSYLTYLRVDAVSAIFLLATGFLYAAVAVYAVGYHKDRYWRSESPRCCWRRCTCSASGTSSGCWPTPAWST
jgi:hydrogenase-4 component F